MTPADSTSTAGGVGTPATARLAQDLACLLGEANAGDVTIDATGTGVHLTREGNQLTVSADTLEELSTLIRVGDLARTAAAAVHNQRARQAAEVAERERERRVEQLRTGTAQDLGFTEAPDGSWTLPGHDRLRVSRLVPERRDLYRMVPWAVVLEVHLDDTLLGVVNVDADGDVTVAGAHERSLLLGDTSGLLGDARTRPLVGANPWRRLVLPQVTSPAEGVEALSGVAGEVIGWIREVDVLYVEAEQVRAARAEEAKEWGRLSRSKDRIPTAGLKTWMKDVSALDYDSTGYAIGGWRVVSEAISGRIRPAHLDGGRRRKSVGVSEVLYAAKLFHARHRGLTPAGVSFSSRQVDALRAALPGCVVKATEDMRYVFVAFDRPEYVEAMDAAMVEHVLMAD